MNTMADQRSMMDALLEQENRQSSSSRGNSLLASGSTSRPNSVWRQKVIHWYSTVVVALRRQYSAEVPETTRSGEHPFNRTTVHVSASLLDKYLMSLPSEKALRYKLDRPAYQLLATTCLLLGLRLTQHDQHKISRQLKTKEVETQQGGLKRAKTLKMNMNQAATPTDTTEVAIPNAATLLRISAAPKSITEQHVLTMVREMTSSRSFPHSKVITALDFITALSATRTHVPRENMRVTLGPAEAEEASRLSDFLLRGSTVSSDRPSVVACAVITSALARSNCVDLDMSSLRQRVSHSIFGPSDEPDLYVAIRMAESSIHVGVPSSRNIPRRVAPTTHLIPLEDE